MPLPPFSSSVYWKEYEIGTPTFRLTPVEKPDMSPFLFHMTGKNEVLSILSGNGVEVPGEHGFLRACVPESNAGAYNAEVVCVTESPTFALDFFRYRSFRRWQHDQRFGIGFDKSELVSIGARPCVYADDQLKNDIIFLRNYIQDNEIKDAAIKDRLQSLINGIYPLTTPLLETSAAQGFMWEREWRYSNNENNGLVFPHKAIRIICCPENEEAEVKDILGKYAHKIQFIRSWKEYNEVTAYLKRRSSEMHIPNREAYKDNEDFISALKEQLQNHRITLNSIIAYKEFMENVEGKESSINEGITELDKSMQGMIQQIQKLQGKL